MDIKKWEMKKVKIAYVVVAAVMAVGAIISAFYHNEYLALAFIMASGLAIFLGALLIRYIYQHQPVDKFD